MLSDEVSHLLHDLGYRVTTPRRAVYEALRHADSHVTVADLTDRVHASRPDVNRASIYRCLALFAELGLARESRLGEQEGGRWELAHPDEHFHLVCRGCGRVDHHRGSLVSQVRDHLIEGHGFEPTTVDLTVTGRCADCLRDSGEPEA